jgi:hypothetical protein
MKAAFLGGEAKGRIVKALTQLELEGEIVWLRL